jgi:hypothetical protein
MVISRSLLIRAILTLGKSGSFNPISRYDILMRQRLTVVCLDTPKRTPVRRALARSAGGGH